VPNAECKRLYLYGVLHIVVSSNGLLTINFIKMKIQKEDKKVLRENLEQRFYTYLCYDQRAHKKFEEPSSKNAQYWGLVKQDAVRMADLVIRELDFMYGE